LEKNTFTFLLTGLAAERGNRPTLPLSINLPSGFKASVFALGPTTADFAAE
jgi:hypothetical protein